MGTKVTIIDFSRQISFFVHFGSVFWFCNNKSCNNKWISPVSIYGNPYKNENYLDECRMKSKRHLLLHCCIVQCAACGGQYLQHCRISEYPQFPSPHWLLSRSRLLSADLIPNISTLHVTRCVTPLVTRDTAVTHRLQVCKLPLQISKMLLSFATEQVDHILIRGK